MKKRKLPGQHQYSDNRSWVKFAKNIFITWDKNKNGRLDVDEIADPMISLGLSKDKPFVEQVVNSIAVSVRWLMHMIIFYFIEIISKENHEEST